MEAPKFNPVIWFEIYVNDIERAKTFYEKVFDIELTELPNPSEHDDMKMLAFPSDMMSPGASGTLVKMNGVEAGGGGTLVYFHSVDCITEESKVEEAGGKIFKPKMSIGDYGFISLIVDSEENMIGLHSLK